MKRMAVLGFVAAWLALMPGRAQAGGWTSNAPVTQHVGPKFGDDLKAGKIKPRSQANRPKKGKNKTSAQ
ncbi:MAG TPA: hypothetical protein VJ873_07850 [bacterium]|nr:hypothetical protein [bacterium]